MKLPRKKNIKKNRKHKKHAKPTGSLRVPSAARRDQTSYVLSHASPGSCKGHEHAFRKLLIQIQSKFSYWYVDCGLSQRAPRTRRLLRHVSRKFGLLVLRVIANSCRALLHVARWFCNLYQHDAARFRSGLWRPRHINLGADFQTSMAEETHLLTRYVLFGKKTFMTDTSDPITVLLCSLNRWTPSLGLVRRRLPK